MSVYRADAAGVHTRGPGEPCDHRHRIAYTDESGLYTRCKVCRAEWKPKAPEIDAQGPDDDDLRQLAAVYGADADDLIADRTRDRMGDYSDGSPGLPRPATPSRRRVVEGCDYCAKYGHEPMMPRHDASRRCESGKRSHCSCSRCF